MASDDKDPPRKAIALKYDRAKDHAPRLTAKGEGFVADRIVEVALAYGIEISENADLVEVLGALDLDTVIPVEAYAAVAEILSYVYKTNASYAQRSKPEGA